MLVAETGNMRWFRQLSLWTSIGAWIVLVLGGLARTTGLALGCRTWPLCDGRLTLSVWW